jgi:general secretion pathway protein B
MSYILEALKKAEQQREIGQVPRIDSEHEPATVGLSSRWVMVVVLILLINAGLLLVLFWPDGSTGVSGPVAMSSDALPVTRAIPPPRPQRADNPGIVSLPEPVTGKVLKHDREKTIVPAQPAVKASAPLVVSKPVPQAIEAPAKTKPVVPPVALPPRPEPVKESAPDQYTRNLPVWPQVPAHIFQQMSGGLKLDVHVYSDQPQDRFVLINLQKYHEGEKLQEGPVLDEITLEGVVLSLQGQQFLVRAQ